MSRRSRLRRQEAQGICPEQGKRGYGSKSAALASQRTNNHRMRPYKCPYCHLWHVTKETSW